MISFLMNLAPGILGILMLIAMPFMWVKLDKPTKVIGVVLSMVLIAMSTYFILGSLLGLFVTVVIIAVVCLIVWVVFAVFVLGGTSLWS